MMGEVVYARRAQAMILAAAWAWMETESTLERVVEFGDLGQMCVARNAAAAPLSGTSDGVVRGDLRWSGRRRVRKWMSCN